MFGGDFIGEMGEQLEFIESFLRRRLLLALVSGVEADAESP